MMFTVQSVSYLMFYWKHLPKQNNHAMSQEGFIATCTNWSLPRQDYE